MTFDRFEKEAERILLALQLPTKYDPRNGIPEGAYKAIAAALREADAKAYERGRKSALDEQKCKDCGCSYERCCCNPVREMEAYEQGVSSMSRAKGGDVDGSGEL